MSETTAARKGEELDVEQLRSFLGSQLDLNEASIDVLQFPAGSSNLTYLVRIGDDEYVLRRPPFGNTVRSAHDMGREFSVLSKLSAIYPPAPKPILYCDDEDVIGANFYLMERRNGLIIRGRSPELLENSPELQSRVCHSFIKNLADLHALDYEAAGLGELGKPEGYARRQVEGWAKRYFAAKTDEHRELESVVTWLSENIPSESGAALVHNDYKFDNVMLNGEDLTKITAVLDWEMVTVGDPLMDLGTTLGYWMSPDAGEDMMSMPFNPYVLMKNIARKELVEMYERASGRHTANMFFYYAFGTFKIAAICQQIYARYVKGLTKDERFAGFGTLVGRLGQIASQGIERGQI